MIPARARRSTPVTMLAIASASSVVLLACSADGREMRVPRPDQNESIITTTLAPEEPVGFDTSGLPEDGGAAFEITASWSEGERIPVQFTCRGSNVSPSVAWFDVDPSAVGIAIVFYEIGVEQIVHWIVANLDPTQAFIESGQLDGPDSAADIVIGLNDEFATGEPGGEMPIQGYRGPCPAAGTSATYKLEVHALGQLVELPSGTPASDLRDAIDLVSIARTTITAYAEG